MDLKNDGASARRWGCRTSALATLRQQRPKLWAKPEAEVTKGGRYRRIGSKLYLRVIYLIKFYSYKMRLSRVRRTEASRAGLWRLGRPVSSSGKKLPSGKKGQSLLT